MDAWEGVAQMTLSVELAPTAGSPEPIKTQYQHVAFTEFEAPYLAEAAWRLHAQGYQDMGFVQKSAIVQSGPLCGTLEPDIDKARGPYVDYRLALNSQGEYAATMREYNVPFGGSYKDLPAYRLCEQNLSDNGKAELKRLAEDGFAIKEISAMARLRGESPVAVHEIIRKALHADIGRRSVWFFSIVTSTYDTLASHSFGAANLVPVGGDTPIQDERVSPDIALRPALLYPDEFLDNLLTAATEAVSPQEKTRLTRSFLFFTDGLDESRMSERVAATRHELQAAKAARGRNRMTVDIQDGAPAPSLSDVQALLAEHAQAPDVWREPKELDLSKEVGRLALAGEFRGIRPVVVVDRIGDIANELFEIRHPDQISNGVLREEFTRDIKDKGAAYGRWFLFDWSADGTAPVRLVHYADRETHREVRTSRHANLVTQDEQQELYGKTVLASGLSVGSNVVRELAAAGIGGTLILADGDTISLSNTNRINAGMPQVGQYKVDNAAIKVSETDPYVRQVHLRHGITAESLKELAANRPDIIFDEVDDMHAKALLREFARREGIPLVMVTDAGDKSIVDVERHDQHNAQPFGGRISEEMFVKLLNGTATPREIMKSKVAVVGLRHISAKLLASFMAVNHTLAGIPQLGSTASKGGALAAVTAREILLGRKMDTGRYSESARTTLKLQPEMPIRQKVQVFVNFFRAIRAARRVAATSPSNA